MENSQRLFPCWEVEPQANGGRKILLLIYKDEDLICSHVKA